MKHVQKSVLLWHSAEQMYQLVAEVESYPLFLPWCPRAEVLERQADATVARLHMVYAGVQQTFTTRNREVLNQSLTMTLVDGPFSMLDGVWQFTPLGAPPATQAQASSGHHAEPREKAANTLQGCRVAFDLRYAFSSRALEAVVSPVFDRIAATFVDAFVQRAEALHGRR